MPEVQVLVLVAVVVDDPVEKVRKGGACAIPHIHRRRLSGIRHS